MFSELFLFLRQNPDTADWRVVVLFAEHSLEPSRTDLHQEWLSSDRVLRIFIEDLPPVAELPLEVALVKLITTPKAQAVEAAQSLIHRLNQESSAALSTAALTDLITTIMVYKFEHLSREELVAM